MVQLIPRHHEAVQQCLTVEKQNDGMKLVGMSPKESAGQYGKGGKVISKVNGKATEMFDDERGRDV